MCHRAQPTSCICESGMRAIRGSSFGFSVASSNLVFSATFSFCQPPILFLFFGSHTMEHIWTSFLYPLTFGLSCVPIYWRPSITYFLLPWLTLSWPYSVHTNTNPRTWNFSCYLCGVVCNVFVCTVGAGVVYATQTAQEIPIPIVDLTSINQQFLSN